MFDAVIICLTLALLMFSMCACASSSVDKSTSFANAATSSASDSDELERYMNIPEVSAFFEYLDWYMDGIQSEKINLSDSEQMSNIANTFKALAESLPAYDGPSEKVKTVSNYCQVIAYGVGIETNYLAISALDQKKGDTRDALDCLEKANEYAQETMSTLQKLNDLMNEIRGK